MIDIEHIEGLYDNLGEQHRCPLVRTIEKPLVMSFCEISQDNSKIHNPDTTNFVTPGNLLISLLPSMLQSGLKIRHYKQCKTASLSNARFYQSVGLGQALVLDYRLIKLRRVHQNYFLQVEMCLRTLDTEQRVLTIGQTDYYEL